MDRNNHYAGPHDPVHISTSPNHSQPSSMIGPSPTYIPTDYNDIHAGIYPGQGQQYYAAQPNPYSSPPYSSHTYDQYSAGTPLTQQQQHQTPSDQDYRRPSQSISPRTGYEGWKEASDPPYGGDQNNSNPLADSQFEFVNGSNGQNQALAYLSGQRTYHAPQTHYTPGPDMTSPETAYFSSPPQMNAHANYDMGAQSNQLQQLPRLFSSPPLKTQQQQRSQFPSPQSAISSPETTRVEGARKIAGTERIQRAGGGVRPSGGSGFSSHSAGSIFAPPPPNPYSQQQNRTGPAAAPAAATMFINADPAGSTTSSNPKKRMRHSTSQSLSVPAQTYGHHQQQQQAQQPQQQPQNQQPLILPAGTSPVRFDPAMTTTTATFEDSSDSDGDSDDVVVEVKSGRGGRGGRGKPGRKGTAGGRNSELARLPGACKNCKRLKMKCVFEADSDITCKRCRDGRKECIVEGRKQRQPSNKREQLMNLLREKDKVIDALLRTVHNPSKLMPVSLRAPSPSALSGGSNQAISAGRPNPPPASATTSAKDIYAWLATSGATKSPGRSDGGVPALDDSSDEEEAAARSGVLDARAKSTSLSEVSGSISQRGRGHKHVKEESQDRLDVQSSASSGGRIGGSGGGGARRPSTGELAKMHSVPDQVTPFGLFAEMSLDSQTAEERGEERAKQNKIRASLSNSSLGSSYQEHGAKANGTNGAEGTDVSPRAPMQDPLEDEALGPANKNYWRPGPAQDLAFRRVVNERNPPELLAAGLIGLEDIDKLFKIFYDRLNVFLSILDPVIHTPADVYGRCPFLFTAVCAVSSRYYTEKPHIYKIAMHFARVAASMALVEGSKSVEICQAYLILSVYPTPARRWEEDRTWMYLRLAIGMATDLALHVPSSTTKFIDERHEREILNRTRTWIICFNLDRSGSTQFGKPPSIKEDSIIRKAATWYKKSPNNHCYDIHMVAYTSLLRLVGEFLEEVYSDPDSPTGLNRNLDFVPVTKRYDARLTQFKDETAMLFRQESDPTDPACHYRSELLPFLVNYSRVVMHSFGFQQAFQRGTLHRGDMFLTACLDSASSVLRIVIDVMAPSGYLRYAADGHFVFAAFASAFLLKLLRPQFVVMLEADQQSRILALINRLIKTLASPEVAVDEHHTPKLYARFLEGLLFKRNQEIAESEQAAGTTPVNGQNSAVANNHPVVPPINTSHIHHVSRPQEPGLMSPKIQVQAPDEDMQNTAVPGIMGTLQESNHLLGGMSMFNGNDSYAYSTTASSTIDAATRDTATQFSGEDILMQGDENWIATMGALDNPAFWTNGMLPGFNWPSPPESTWQAPISSEMNLSQAIQPDLNAQHQQQQQHYASLLSMNR